MTEENISEQSLKREITKINGRYKINQILQSHTTQFEQTLIDITTVKINGKSLETPSSLQALLDSYTAFIDEQREIMKNALEI